MVANPARVPWALPALLLAACTVSSSDGGTTGSGACAGPLVTITDTTVTAGQELLVRVEGLKDGCADSIGMNEDGEVIHQETEVPLGPVAVVFEQGGLRELLGTVSADDDFTAAVTVTIPAQAVPGEAILRLEHPFVTPVVLEVEG